MTTPAHSLPASVARSYRNHGSCPLKNPAGSIDHATASRRWFAAMLWRAFPLRSEHAIAKRAAKVLDVSPRQVRNWLKCEHDASLRYVMAVIAIAGAEIVFRHIEGRE